MSWQPRQMPEDGFALDDEFPEQFDLVAVAGCDRRPRPGRGRAPWDSGARVGTALEDQGVEFAPVAPDRNGRRWTPPPDSMVGTMKARAPWGCDPVGNGLFGIVSCREIEFRRRIVQSRAERPMRSGRGFAVDCPPPGPCLGPAQGIAAAPVRAAGSAPLALAQPEGVVVPGAGVVAEGGDGFVGPQFDRVVADAAEAGRSRRPGRAARRSPVHPHAAVAEAASLETVEGIDQVVVFGGAEGLFDNQPAGQGLDEDGQAGGAPTVSGCRGRAPRWCRNSGLGRMSQ